MGKYQGGLVYHWEGPAGHNIQKDWIYIPDKGIRRITLDELIQLKGLNNTRYSAVSLQVLSTSVEQHVWATIGEVIRAVLLRPTAIKTSPQNLRTAYYHKTIEPSSTTILSDAWNWTPPDLSIGSSFYKERIKNLRFALSTLGKNEEHIYNEGIDILAHHWLNYGPNGPVSLTVLWWEWPQTHWEELRNGASMNFMETPRPGIIPNQELKGDTLLQSNL